MIALFVVLLFLTLHQSDASYVDTLTTANFSSFNSDITVVMFYAPWCSYSKSFMPIFDALSEQLFEENKHSQKNVSLAKVNCVDEPNIYYKEKIEGKGFPTLKFYLKGSSGDGLFYSDERIEPLILTQIRKLRDKSSLIDIDEIYHGLTYEDKVNRYESDYLTAMKPIAIYNVIDKTNKDYINNIEYACIKLDISCAVITGSSNDLLLIRNFIGEVKTVITPPENLLDANVLYDWFQDYAFPLVVEFTVQNQDHIFSRRKGFNVHVIAASEQMDESLANELRILANKYKGKCIFITIDSSSTDEYTQTIMKELNIKPNSKAIEIVHSNQDKMDFYQSENSHENFVEMLETFVEDYFAKKIKPTKTRLAQD